MRIVFDTNVLLAAFGTRGLCESLFDLCLAQHEIVLCAEILDEVSEHLGGKFRVPESRVQSIVRFLRIQSIMVIPADVPGDACRDAEDLMVLGAGVAGNAEVIVTGDKDLLSIGSYSAIRILTPRALFLELN